jgi:SOS-response transcriptional repressor LexA
MLIETRVAAWWLIEADLPGRAVEPIGVLLLESEADALHLKLRRDWDAIAGEDDAEVLQALADDLDHKARELGAAALIGLLEDSLSNTIRLSDRGEVLAAHPERALMRLYREYVPASVLPFRTHLPLYSLRVAAGKFLDNDEVTEEGWEETPEDLRLTRDMFVARIEGHSMEPHIPDGSLAVFRSSVTGSRQGRLVLVEDPGAGGTNRYTVKRYRSEKAASREKAPAAEAEWRHTRIRLESLNPEYPSWDLDPEADKYRIIAEFERVLE